MKKKDVKVSQAVSADPSQLNLQMDGFRFQCLSRGMGLLFLHDIVQPLRDSLLDEQCMDKLEHSLENILSDLKRVRLFADEIDAAWRNYEDDEEFLI